MHCDASLIIDVILRVKLETALLDQKYVIRIGSHIKRSHIKIPKIQNILREKAPKYWQNCGFRCTIWTYGDNVTSAVCTKSNGLIFGGKFLLFAPTLDI